MENKIDVKHVFTEDVDGFWEEFWSNSDGLGHITDKNDPDSKSKNLQQQHLTLWNKGILGNELFAITDTDNSFCLKYKNMRLSSDSMINSFRWTPLILPFNLKEEFEKNGLDYKTFQEDYLKKTFTIGAMIIFPKHRNSVNQRRGCNSDIKDRFDLTLECIKRYYAKDSSYNPLKDILQNDKDYFDLFIDFKGFVDFFLLQDWVDENYNIEFMLDFDDFKRSPMPQNFDEYMCLYKKQLDLTEKRNNRIENLLKINHK